MCFKKTYMCINMYIRRWQHTQKEYDSEKEEEQVGTIKRGEWGIEEEGEREPARKQEEERRGTESRRERARERERGRVCV